MRTAILTSGMLIADALGGCSEITPVGLTILGLLWVACLANDIVDVIKTP